RAPVSMDRLFASHQSDVPDRARFPVEKSRMATTLVTAALVYRGLEHSLTMGGPLRRKAGRPALIEDKLLACPVVVACASLLACVVRAATLAGMAARGARPVSTVAERLRAA